MQEVTKKYSQLSISATGWDQGPAVQNLMNLLANVM